MLPLQSRSLPPLDLYLLRCPNFSFTPIAQDCNQACHVRKLLPRNASPHRGHFFLLFPLARKGCQALLALEHSVPCHHDQLKAKLLLPSAGRTNAEKHMLQCIECAPSTTLTTAHPSFAGGQAEHLCIGEQTLAHKHNHRVMLQVVHSIQKQDTRHNGHSILLDPHNGALAIVWWQLALSFGCPQRFWPVLNLEALLALPGDLGGESPHAYECHQGFQLWDIT